MQSVAHYTARFTSENFFCKLVTLLFSIFLNRNSIFFFLLLLKLKISTSRYSKLVLPVFLKLSLSVLAHRALHSIFFLFLSRFWNLFHNDFSQHFVTWPVWSFCNIAYKRWQIDVRLLIYWWENLNCAKFTGAFDGTLMSTVNLQNFSFEIFLIF